MKWSPKWSRTGDHGPALNGTQRHVRPIFAIQINTCRDRTKRAGTAANKFRVRCFQPSLAPAMPRRTRGKSGPQPSMPGLFRQAYLDVKGEQSLEQLGLAIKMMLAEPAARYLFAAVLE